MDLLNLAENPVPEGAVVASLVTDDGYHLRAARWPATQSPARGTVCLFPGRAEQIEKYFHVVVKLRQRGFAVAVLDWRGQGGSTRILRDPMRGHALSFADFGRDIEAFANQFVRPNCPAPYFGLGHSMGGHNLLAAAPKPGDWLERIVLTAPFLGFPPSGLSHAGVRRLARMLTWLGLGRIYAPGQLERVRAMGVFEGNALTSDIERFQVMKAIGAARPDLTISAATVGWVYAAALSIDRLAAEDFPARVPMPVLLFNAGADQVVSRLAVETMARRLRGAAYVLISGSRHEILMEREIFARQFWAAFDAFVPGSPPV